MKSNPNIKLDEAAPLEYIKMVAQDFEESGSEKNIPAGDHWHKNHSVDYYHGMLSTMGNVLNGMMHLKQGNTTADNLYYEFSIIIGQLAKIIIEKTPKIITLDNNN